MTRLGSPALDLTYFLFSSTDRSQRSAQMQALLRDYHTACSELIGACGSDAEKLYSFEDVLQQIRLFGGHALTVAPMMIGVMVSESKDITDMDEYADAMETGGEVEYFLKFNDKSTGDFVDRLGGVIDDAIRLKCVDEL